ncbi:MAG: pilus assembly PilX family protein [Vicinamibacteria bacterium]
MKPARVVLSPRAFREQGSAFVISMLILFVLSVLGIALMLTTTTEKDIAINYRWGEQAFFNADAALEYGKNLLGNYLLANGDFSAVLPPARNDVTVADASQIWGAAHPDPGACNPTSAGCREYQFYVDHCPPGGGGPCVRVYIGRVLPRPDGTLAQYDFRAPGGAVAGDLDGDEMVDLQGSFTLWVRRPIVGTRDYGVADAANPNGLHDRVILTAEGTAPGAMGAGAARPVSLRRLEMVVRRPTTGIEGDQYGRVTGGSDSGTRQSGYDEVQSTGLPGTP